MTEERETPAPGRPARIVASTSDGIRWLAEDKTVWDAWFEERSEQVKRVGLFLDRRCLHTEDRWNVWSDGVIMRDVKWIDAPGHPPHRRSLNGSASALAAATLFAEAGSIGEDLEPGTRQDQVAALLTADDHTLVTVATRSTADTTTALIRHDFYTATVGQVAVWQVTSRWRPAEGPQLDRYSIWRTETAARTAYTTPT